MMLNLFLRFEYFLKIRFRLFYINAVTNQKNVTNVIIIQIIFIDISMKSIFILVVTKKY